MDSLASSLNSSVERVRQLILDPPITSGPSRPILATCPPCSPRLLSLLTRMVCRRIETARAAVEPLLGQIMPRVLASLDAEDVVQTDNGEAPEGLAAVAAKLSKGGGGGGGGGGGAGDGEDADDDDDDDDDDEDAGTWPLAGTPTAGSG